MKNNSGAPCPLCVTDSKQQRAKQRGEAALPVCLFCHSPHYVKFVMVKKRAGA